MRRCTGRKLHHENFYRSAALLAAAPAFAQSAADELRTLNFNLQQQEMQRQFEQQAQQQMVNTMRPQRVYGVGGACMFNCY